GAVTEDMRQEPRVGQAFDRPVERVVEAIQRIDLVRLDEEVQDARDSGREEETDEHEAEEEHQGGGERVAVKRPARENQRLCGLERSELRERNDQYGHAADRQRQVQKQQLQQLHGGVGGPSQGAAGGRLG